MSYSLYPNAWNDFYAGFSTKYAVSHPITRCGVSLKVYMTITKGKPGLGGGCSRFFGIECGDLQDAVIRSVDPQNSCLKEVQDSVRWFCEEEGVEVDLNSLEISFDHFWWDTIEEL